MKMRAYKTEIDPTEMQIQQIKCTQGVCRFVYNLSCATRTMNTQSGPAGICLTVRSTRAVPMDT